MRYLVICERQELEEASTLAYYLAQLGAENPLPTVWYVNSDATAADLYKDLNRHSELQPEDALLVCEVTLNSWGRKLGATLDEVFGGPLFR